MVHREVPLSIEPVLGWRAWHLTRQRDGLRLQGVTEPETWPPQAAIPAGCARFDHDGAPLERCSCGYYAAGSLPSLAGARVFSRGVGVIGAIAMWGKVIQHTRGARSEFAYPARLRLVCSPCARAGTIIDPVKVVEDLRLVPVCDRHLRSRLGGSAPATDVEAELLSAYGVELLPRPHIPLRAARSGLFGRVATLRSRS